MNNTLFWEMIGYVGSALVLVSLLMSSVVKLRIINLIGSLVFAVYAFQIHSIPTAFMNLALVGINLYYLVRYLLQKKSKTFTILSVEKSDSAVKNMARRYESDMELYFGRVDLSSADMLLAVYEGETLAGLTAGKTDGDGIELILDYTTPSYRDCSVGGCILETLAKEYHFKKVSFRNPTEKHVSYLLKMGFSRDGEVYRKEL